MEDAGIDFLIAVRCTVFGQPPHNSRAGEVAALQGAAELQCGETWPEVMRSYRKTGKMEGKLSVRPKAGGSLFLRNIGNNLLDQGSVLLHDA
jgi:hypothetical protein